MANGTVAQPDVFDSAISSALGTQPTQQSPTSAPDVFDTAIASALGHNPPITQQQQTPGVGERVWQAAKSMVTPLIDPPQTHTEAGISLVGGLPALTAFRAAKGVVDAAKHMATAAADEYPQAVQDFNNAVEDYHSKNFSGMAADAASTASDVAGVVKPTIAGPANEVRKYAQDTKPGGNLAGDLTQGVIGAGLTAAAPEVLAEAAPEAAGVTEGAEGAEGAEAAGNEATATTAAPETATPTMVQKAVQSGKNLYQEVTQSGKNLYQQVAQGADVAQPAAQSAMTSGAEASAEDAGVANDVPALAHNQPIRTLLDEPISALADKESAAYDTLNTAAGTDLKALYDHAEEIQDALDDPTNVSQRAALKEDLQTTQDAITTGEAKATANGVSPDLLNDAKAMTQQRYAMQNLKQKLFNNESVVKGNAEYGSPETIDVNSAIRQAENLNKPSKYAPEGSPTRLQQALGQNGTRKLLQDLYNAQKTGVKAVRVQNIAKLVGKAAGIGSAGLGIHFLSELL